MWTLIDPLEKKDGLLPFHLNTHYSVENFDKRTNHFGQEVISTQANVQA
jgi:hypothetical protein